MTNKFIFAGLLVLAGIHSVAASSASIVVCEACKNISSTPDIVTRAPVPTTPCTEPALISVPVTAGVTATSPAWSGGNSSSTLPPVTAAANGRAITGAGGVVAVAVVAAMLV